MPIYIHLLDPVNRRSDGGGLSAIKYILDLGESDCTQIVAYTDVKVTRFFFHYLPLLFRWAK